MTPDCPVCKTNKYMVIAYDYSTHTGGIDEDGNYCCTYSDRFECSQCGGVICYHEETVSDEICAVEIHYRQKNYNRLRRVVEA